MKRQTLPRLRLYQLALLSTTAAVTVAIGIEQASAADSWWSRVRTAGDELAKAQAQGPVAASQDSANSIFDIVISLHSNPQGDDEYPADSGPDDDEQNTYEEIIEHFADSVCEQSNGAHHLGKVRIFREGRQANRADIRWVQSCHPSATPSGFGVAGKNINMCDDFNGHDMLADKEGAGYTLGHEWGHYALGLFDEYRGSVANPPQGDYWPRSTDQPTDPSIMNRQWNAIGGNFEWLNHSTSDNIGDTDRTAQGRVFGKSGWETLIDSTENDPNDPFTAFNTTRTRYTNLDSVRPRAADNWVVENLPGGRNDCRSDLDIIWMQDDVEMQVVFDKSGSMSGTPITNARTAANTLVDVVEGDHTALGVVTFDSNVNQLVGITPIPDPGNAERNNIKNAISGINASGLTAMFDGLDVALNGLQAFSAANNTSAGQVAFLLSDGGDNSSSTNQAQIEAAYRAADVPIIAFGYGSGAPGGVLAALASATGGQFFSSPTTLAEIQAAFLAANTVVANTVAPSSGVNSVPPAGGSIDITIDSTIAQMVVSVSFVGAPGEVDFELLGPSGASTGVSFDCQQSGSETSCLASVDERTLRSLGDGLYTLEVTNNTGSDVDVSHFVSASPMDGFTYDVTLANLGGQTVTYPTPLVIGATVSKEYPIAGLNVSATVTTPSGSEVVLDMNDEGRDGDITAGDGTYSALFSYDENGTHSIEVSVDNDAGSAEFTEAGYVKSVLPDGTEAPPQSFPAITENFARTSTLQVQAQGVVADDHANDPTSGNCTAIEADNSDTAGKIETAGDVDCFSIATVDVTKDLVVRVDGLAFDMEPDVTVFASDGTTVIEQGTVGDHPNGRGAMAMMIDATDLDPAGLFITVQHEDATAAGGTYNVSAGDKIPSDEPPVAVKDDDDDEDEDGGIDGGGGGDGGGALGPVTLFFLSVLGGLAILRRRFALLRS